MQIPVKGVAENKDWSENMAFTYVDNVSERLQKIWGSKNIVEVLICY